MFFTILFHSFKFDLRPKILAILTSLLATALISSLLAISLDVGDKMAREMKAYGANIVIEPNSLFYKDFSKRELKNRDFLEEQELALIKSIFWLNNIVGFAPLLSAPSDEGIVLTGTYFNKKVPTAFDPNYQTGQKIISPYWQIKGKFPNDEKNEALVGEKLAKEKNYKIGDIVKLSRENRQISLEIVGILKTGGEEEEEIISNLKLAQELFNLEGKVEKIIVSALTVPENELSQKVRTDSDKVSAEEFDRWYCTAYVSSIAKQIEEVISNSTAKPIWQVASSQGILIKKIQILLSITSLAAIFSASLAIASLMSANILERSKEIGLMKALGAKNWQISLIFYSEAAFSGFLGAILGIFLGFLISKSIAFSLFKMPLNFAWILIPLVIFLALLISLLGSWFSIRHLEKLNTVEVLYV